MHADTMLINFGNNTVYKLTVIIVISGKWEVVELYAAC